MASADHFVASANTQGEGVTSSIMDIVRGHAPRATKRAQLGTTRCGKKSGISAEKGVTALVPELTLVMGSSA